MKIRENIPVPHTHTHTHTHTLVRAFTEYRSAVTIHCVTVSPDSFVWASFLPHKHVTFLCLSRSEDLLSFHNDVGILAPPPATAHHSSGMMMPLHLVHTH